MLGWLVAREKGDDYVGDGSAPCFLRFTTTNGTLTRSIELLLVLGSGSVPAMHWASERDSAGFEMAHMGEAPPGWAGPRGKRISSLEC